jgi:hypothetical protein
MTCCTLGNKGQINISKQQKNNTTSSITEVLSRKEAKKMLYITYRGTKTRVTLETKLKGAHVIRFTEN